MWPLPVYREFRPSVIGGSELNYTAIAITAICSLLCPLSPIPQPLSSGWLGQTQVGPWKIGGQTGGWCDGSILPLQYSILSSKETAVDIQAYLGKMCNGVIPRCGRACSRQALFWTKEIAGLRRSCVASLRTHQRVDRRGAPRAYLCDVFRAVRKQLRLTIRQTQEIA